jgi:hypothetical protein
LEDDWRKEHLFVLGKARAQYQEVLKQIQDSDRVLLEYTQQLEACTTMSKPANVVCLKAELWGAEPA